MVTLSAELDINMLKLIYKDWNVKKTAYRCRSQLVVSVWVVPVVDSMRGTRPQ